MARLDMISDNDLGMIISDPRNFPELIALGSRALGVSSGGFGIWLVDLKFLDRTGVL